MPSLVALSVTEDGSAAMSFWRPSNVNGAVPRGAVGTPVCRSGLVEQARVGTAAAAVV
jgi:hypothetical protein